MNYSQKLRDPRWQKKRLEVMKRDNWRCQHCWTARDTLTVHHAVYTKGRDPWEYNDSNLITLCSTCHTNLETYSLHEARRTASLIEASVGFELFCRLQSVINEIQQVGRITNAFEIAVALMHQFEDEISEEAKQLCLKEFGR